MKICPFLLDNLEALRKSRSPIYGWLSEQSTSAEALNERIFINRFGMMDWRTEEGHGLMENIPPQSVYARWTEVKNPATSATIVVGSNLGYGINHLLTNTPDSHKVVVIEPDANILAACLGQTDYWPFFENKKLHFCVPTEKYLNMVVQQMDLQFIYGSIHVRGDTPSMQLGPQYAQWTQRTRKCMENFTVELTTLRYRQDLMVKNELTNYERSLRDGSLKSLEGRAKGLSAVILGAGPSMAKHAGLLREHRGDALYTTSLQTLPVLQNHDLKPDLCLAIDYSDGMLKLYDRLDLDWAADIPLIYSTKLDPRVLERYPGPTIPMWTLGGMATYVMQGREMVLDAGGNVSLTLLRLLSWMGVSRITLAGQDFAWKGDSTHAEGHHNANLKIRFREGSNVRLKNLDGEEIISSLQYLTSKREMEKDIESLAFPVCNLYGGYAPIEGAQNIDFDQALAEAAFTSAPGAKAAFFAAMNVARRPVQRPVFESRIQLWSTSMRNVEKKLTKLFRKLSRSQTEIHDIFERMLFFLKQDRLYAPYLYNEIIDASGLARARRRYEPKDLPEFKRLAKRILAKVREVDNVFGARRAA